MRFSKLKLFGLATLLGTTLSAKAANQDANANYSDPAGKNEIKQDTLTILQMETYIEEGKQNLEKYKKIFSNKKLSMDKRSEALRAYNTLLPQLEEMENRLREAQGLTATAMFSNFVRKEKQNMTVQEMEAYIKEADIVLKRIHEIQIEPYVSTSERVAARDAYKDLTKKRDEMQKKLDLARKNASKTVAYNDANVR